MELKLTQYPIAAVSTDLTLGKYYECEEVFYCDSIYNVFDDAGCRHEVEKVCFEDTEERTPEWHVEGLPPVGTECECIIDTGEYLPCKVVDHGKDYVVVHFHPNIHNYKVDWTRTGCRPIKSEKDKEIEKIDDAIDEWQDEVEMIAEKSLAEYLYENGFRFVEES